MNNTQKNEAVDPEFQEMVDVYNGKVKPAGEVKTEEALTVTENDLIVAAASMMDAPAGSTPEQLKHFEELRKLAIAKAGGSGK